LRGSLAQKEVQVQGACAVGADVQCPGSGSMCAGDQCCPGYACSGGGTFPCPSASSGFSGCVNITKVTDCLSSSVRLSSASDFDCWFSTPDMSPEAGEARRLCR
jgi:hypothetical protein